MNSTMKRKIRDIWLWKKAEHKENEKNRQVFKDMRNNILNMKKTYEEYV